MAGVKEILQRVDKLPAFPSTATKLLKMLQSSTWDVNVATKTIRNDEILSAAILRCANSVAFGSNTNTFDLHQSIVRLGARNLVQIAIDQSVAPLMQDRGSSFGLRRGALWRSALAGALAAEMLAKDLPDANTELVYIAALMRDIGKIVLDLAYGEEYRDLVEPFVSDDTPYCDIERRAIGCDHSQLGAELARQWNIPDPIPNAILFHHNPPPPDSPDHSTICDVVHAADMIARWAGFAIGDDGMQYSIADHVRISFNLNSRTIERYAADARVSLESIDTNYNSSPGQEVAA
jgi:putative nucleotidyltransferase with HDIG domain